jgi:hypothetical protein
MKASDARAPEGAARKPDKMPKKSRVELNQTGGLCNGGADDGASLRQG